MCQLAVDRGFSKDGCLRSLDDAGIKWIWFTAVLESRAGRVVLPYLDAAESNISFYPAPQLGCPPGFTPDVGRIAFILWNFKALPVDGQSGHGYLRRVNQCSNALKKRMVQMPL